MLRLKITWTLRWCLLRKLQQSCGRDSSSRSGCARVAAAAASATTSTNSATASAGSATTASNHVAALTHANTSLTHSNTSSTHAATSLTHANTSLGHANNAQSSLNSFQAIYLGEHASAPSTSGVGEGSLYWNSTLNQLYVLDSGSWNQAAFNVAGAVIASNNLSDLADAKRQLQI